VIKVLYLLHKDMRVYLSFKSN